MPELSLVDEAAELLEQCRSRGWSLATAESCTGGLIVATLTEVPGSSDVVDRGFVTYSNGAKTAMLGVPAELIEDHGAVSPEVAEAMVWGALEHSAATVALACTGVAGPGGGSAEKPVGLVYVACGRADAPVRVERHRFPGDRAAVRAATVRAAFAMLRALL